MLLKFPNRLRFVGRKFELGVTANFKRVRENVPISHGREKMWKAAEKALCGGWAVNKAHDVIKTACHTYDKNGSIIKK